MLSNMLKLGMDGEFEIIILQTFKSPKLIKNSKHWLSDRKTREWSTPTTSNKFILSREMGGQCGSNVRSGKFVRKNSIRGEKLMDRKKFTKNKKKI